MLCQHIEGKGSEKWVQTFIQNLDYLANPQIFKKNYALLEIMITNYLPVFEGNQKLFQEVIFKVANHARECYGMKTHN